MLFKRLFHIDLTIDNLDLGEMDIEQLFQPFDAPPDPFPELPRLPALEAGPPHDPTDWRYLKKWSDTSFADLADHYYRTVQIGIEKLKEEGPLIIAPNHSGNAFPHDAMIMDGTMWRYYEYSRKLKFRSVFAPKLAAVWWMRPYGINNWWRRGGGVDMTFRNFDHLLALKQRVLYYPEGVPGIGKGFTRRYQLQHFYSSFVVLAARHDAPVYPVSIVNAEWINPLSITLKPVDWFCNKFLGIPFFPVPIGFLTILFPFMFYFAFPCKMTFVFQDPIDIRALLREEGCPDAANPSREMAQRVAERVRQIAQTKLDAAVEEYGKKPYDFKEFWRKMREIRGRIFRASPLGWPYLFTQHDRDLQRPPARNKIHAFLRDWDILLFYVPFGWFFLALTRRFRKPPCGFRGLTKQERAEREGNYRWSLDTRPLKV